MVYAAVEIGLGRDCDATATSGITWGYLAGSTAAAVNALRRLEFAAFSVKSMTHDIRG
jgi:hypothetical protein